MLCDKKHSHVQWRDFKMNVLVCDDDQQIVDWRGKSRWML